MTLRDDMKLVLAGVLDATGGLGETWTYQKRSSNRDEAAAFSGGWLDVATHPTDHQIETEDDAGSQARTETIMVRVPSTTNIEQGDQMKNPAGVIWHVAHQISSGVGTNRWMLQRKSQDLLGNPRGGGF